MPKAICANSTRFPSAHPFTAGAAGPAPATLSSPRRFLLAGAAAALAVAGVAAVPLPAGAEPVGADAELIRHCDGVVQVEAELRAIYAVRHTAEDEERTEPDLDRLYAREESLLEAIDALPPLTTLAGARAMSRAALAMALKKHDGSLDLAAGDDPEWLALTVAEFLAGRAPA